jgi:hypothetical protein
MLARYSDRSNSSSPDVGFELHTGVIGATFLPEVAGYAIGRQPIEKMGQYKSEFCSYAEV